MKRSFLTFTCLLMTVTGISNAAENATPILDQPSQMASALSPNLEARPVFEISRPMTKNFTSVETPRERFTRHLWIASLVAVAASTSMDAATSWGKQEGNGFLASSNGSFGARGVSIKAGMLAGVVVPQLIFRKNKQLRAKFAIGNLVEAGIFTGVSIHNLGVTSR